MNESKQKKVLLIIIAILVIANTVTLFLFMQKSPQKKDRQNSRKNNTIFYLKNDLNYNDVQIASYDSLHKKHMESTESLFKEMRIEKEKNLKLLSQKGFSDSITEIAANTIAEKQKIVEIKMLRYLHDMRSIGTPAQQAKFDTTFFTFMNKEKSKSKRN